MMEEINESFFDGSTVKKKNGKKQDVNYGTEGMCFGAALEAALCNNMGVGICIGMMTGLVIGSMIHKGQNSSVR